MATEPSVDRSVEASATSAEPTLKIDPDARQHHGDAQVNGTPPAADEIENKLISDIVDDLVNSAEVSTSGGSDTEASRADTSKSKDDDKGHTRTSSTVKKPTSFKSVSVNKTFLASKGATSSAPSKTSDKAAPTASPVPGQSSIASGSARPRLVAKSGSGLRDVPKSGSNGRPGGVPDAAAVWNKNRPAPVPEPKKMTDEELKKYGIHMATRLHTDDSKGQANWADIDDDDEDWAPETITWTDGTKVTIPHVDEHPPPAPAPAPAPVHVPAPEVTAPPVVRENKILEKPRSPAPPAGSPSIKPGVLASGKGLILKGAPEKPTLVAKPPAPPTPVKSPWATLPPVDKASPILMDISSHQTSRLPPAGHAQIPKGTTPPPQTKEIAADDFSRSTWREGPPHGNRELYNSQSGRYEPVTDRRGSTRGDAHSRQLPLLQRSLQTDNAGPAEPSPAFQTTHTSGQYGHGHGRRRGSSNVSGGSGSYLQRLGKPHEQGLPPPELLNARRGSFTGGSETSVSPRNFSPSGLQGGPRHSNQPWQARVSPAIANATLHYSPGSTEAHLVPGEHPAAGTPTGVPGEDDYEYQKKLMRERRELAKKRRLEAEAKEEAERKERIRLKLEALGPPPESKSAKKDSLKESTPTPHIQPREISPDSQATTQPDTKQSHTGAASRPDADKNSDNLPNGARSLSHTQTTSGKLDTVTTSDNKHGHSWQPRLSSQPDRDRLGSAWGPGNQISSRNVWGSPNNDRSLGNGTFVSDLGRVPDTSSSQLSQMSAPVSGPGPIGPPGSNKPGPKPESASSRLAPIGPPQSGSRYSASQRAASSEQGLRASAWASAVQDGDVALASERRQQMAEKERELQTRGASYSEAQGKIADNWRPTKTDGHGRRLETSDRDARAQSSTPSWNVAQQDASKHDTTQRPPTAGAQPPSSNATPQPRGSRFFPSRDVRLEEAAPSETGRSLSPSPPPPDMVGHPAFDGDATHPHVALPPTRPVVRLPPAPPAASTGSRPSHPSLNWANPAPFRDASATHAHPHRPAPLSHGIGSGVSTLRPAGENWQERIHDLLAGRKPSPTKPVPVDSSSRNALHPSASYTSATVSLPASSARNAGVDDASLTTKIMDEDCFEEQEMGSLPPVRIPSTVSEAAWHPALTPKPAPRKFMLTAPTSAEAVSFIQEASLHILLPGMLESKHVPSPSSPRTRSNPRRGRGGSRYPPSQRGGKRDSSAPYSSDYASPAGSNTPSGSRGGRGGYRGNRSDNWSRQPSATIQT